jgi:hypothetical protein
MIANSLTYFSGCGNDVAVIRPIPAIMLRGGANLSLGECLSMQLATRYVSAPKEYIQAV